MTQEVYRPTIPAALAEEKQSSFKTKYIAGGLLLLLFVGYLSVQMVQATRTTGAYYMTVQELLASGDELHGERVRVNGNVVGDSEDWDANNVTLRFSIQDENGATDEVLPIVFFGPRPDNFQRAASAIIEGELMPDGTFQAETLLLKCPSRYEEEPEEVHVEAVR
ncbi:MAG: cytochrome c maturation protein CcmE [Caldilineaceae bacterium]|nr:cytochrome c maturation protein CcmE [Caldilineaceae bacterium]